MAGASGRYIQGAEVSWAAIGSSVAVPVVLRRSSEKGTEWPSTK
jgi:hypothetical protein